MPHRTNVDGSGTTGVATKACSAPPKVARPAIRPLSFTAVQAESSSAVTPGASRSLRFCRLAVSCLVN